MLATIAAVWLAVGATPHVPDDSIFRRMAAVLEAEGFVQIHLITAQKRDLPFKIDTIFTNDVSGLVLIIKGWQLSRPLKDSALQRWGRDSAVTPPEGSLSGTSIGERSAHSWDAHGSGGWLRILVDRYELSVHVSVPDGKEPLTDPSKDGYAKALCERIARVVLADAMAIDLADDGRELGTSRMTGNEAPKDGYVALGAWAARERATVAYAAATASATLTAHGRTVRLLLASDKAIVDGAPVGLDGKYVLARGALWLVPDRELTAAVR